MCGILPAEGECAVKKVLPRYEWKEGGVRGIPSPFINLDERGRDTPHPPLCPLLPRRTYLPDSDIGYAFEERARELGRAGVPAQFARSHLIEVEYLIDGGAQPS